jgi:predicted enzyme related to lactoylglutathione lyase
MTADAPRTHRTDEFSAIARSKSLTPMLAPSTPVVHLELHTGDLLRAHAFYSQLCDWHPDRVDTRHGSYHTLELGGGLGGGIVECATARPLWLPYVEVSEIGAATERARDLGAAILLDAREGPGGWRSVVATPAGGEIAFWQAKR